MNHETRLSFQKVFNSSIVLAAPRIRANKTSTPPSARPQKELQKSSVRFCSTGEDSRAYLDNEVVEDVLLAAISEFGEISVEKQDWIWRPYFIRPNVQNAHVWSKPYQEGQSAFQVLGTQLLNRDRRSDVRLFVFFQWQWSVLDLALPHCLCTVPLLHDQMPAAKISCPKCMLTAQDLAKDMIKCMGKNQNNSLATRYILLGKLEHIAMYAFLSSTMDVCRFWV